MRDKALCISATPVNIQQLQGCHHLRSTTLHYRDITSMHLQYDDCNLPDDIQFADPTFHIPGRIDMLLGAELFFELLRPERRNRPGSYPVLQNTELGWVLSGKVQSSNSDDGLTHPQRSFFIREDASLDLQL
jgi:hypothetical protein